MVAVLLLFHYYLYILISFFFAHNLGTGLYDTAKCQSNIDTLRLSDLSENSNLKKVTGLVVENGSSGMCSFR